jgi:hypothetical protein
MIVGGGFGLVARQASLRFCRTAAVGNSRSVEIHNVNTVKNILKNNPTIDKHSL